MLALWFVISGAVYHLGAQARLWSGRREPGHLQDASGSRRWAHGMRRVWGLVYQHIWPPARWQPELNILLFSYCKTPLQWVIGSTCLRPGGQYFLRKRNRMMLGSSFFHCAICCWSPSAPGRRWEVDDARVSSSQMRCFKSLCPGKFWHVLYNPDFDFTLNLPLCKVLGSLAGNAMHLRAIAAMLCVALKAFS